MTFQIKRSCRDVTHLVLQGHDRELVWHERLALRIHWTICDGCRRFARQADFMKQAMGHWRGYRDSDDAA